MSGIIRRIFGKGKASDEETRNEAGEVMRSASRKASYKTWLCGMCKHESFYKILRCVLCGSNSIKPVVNPVSGIVMFERADISYTVSELGVDKSVAASMLKRSVLVAANEQHMFKQEK